MAIRILIADDDLSIRRLIIRLIEAHPDWSICGDARNGQEAVTKASELSPDVVVLDLAMPQMNGLQAAREIIRHQPDTPLLLLTVQQVSKELTKEAVLAGFKGAVSKSTGSEVVRAIESLLNHQNFFDPIRGDAYVDTVSGMLVKTILLRQQAALRPSGNTDQRQVEALQCRLAETVWTVSRKLQ